MEFAHRSVLLHECIDALAIKPDGIYLDGTLGGAGHSLEICRSLTTGRLIGVDRDLVALEAAKKRLYRHAKKVTLVHDNFENVGAILTALGLAYSSNVPKVNGLVGARKALVGFLAPLAKADIFPFSRVRITTLLSYSPIGSAFRTIPSTLIRSCMLFPILSLRLCTEGRSKRAALV